MAANDGSTSSAEGAVDDPPKPRRSRGRPRNEELDKRVLEAALGLIDAGEPVTLEAVVARSGVARGTIYLRWPSMNELIAAALDTGLEQAQELPIDGDIAATLHEAMRPPYMELPPERFRQRLRLTLTDPGIQEAYWRTQVSPRRAPIERALRAGIAAGVLRDDVDAEAVADLMSGMVYYQVVARGATLDDPEVEARCTAGLEIVWRGLLADR